MESEPKELGLAAESTISTARPDQEGSSGSSRRRRRRRRPSAGAARAPAGTKASPDGSSSAEETAPAAAEPARPGHGEQPVGQGRTGSRRRRSRGSRGRKPAVPAGPGAEAPAEEAASEGQSTPAKARQARTKKADGATALAVAEPPADEATEEAGTAPARRRRRRRGGRGRSRARPSEEVAAAEGDAGEPRAAGPAVAPEGSTSPAATPTRARRTRQRTSRPGAKREQAPAEAEGGRAPAGRGRRAHAPARRRRERVPEPVRATDKTMLITEIGDRHQIAVLEDRILVEHYITRSGARSMVGNIYLGKVQNVLPGMEAAFVDVGRGRNAVLYAGEVSYDEEIEGEAPRIEHVLKSGQNVMVQVTKDPMGGKGARLTQEISLPGRYLVLVPNNPQVFGISRRLPDAERRRLRDVLKKVKPAEHGLIVRTAAEGAEGADLEADLARLTDEWGAIAKSAKRGKAPRVLYEEPELTVRVVRDLFTEGEFKEMLTDSPEVYRRVTAYLEGVAPDLLPKVRMHEGKLPVLEAYHAAEQILKALERKVWLPSGGYIVIDRTEAMTVIDVNTGKHVGKANLEETVTKTNLEAAEEVARQLRLRDIGGIIIVDFIDMLLERNKEKVVQTLRAAMARDKTRSQIFDIGPLGLLEVTRKRVSAGLLESFSETCPTCEGRGILLTYKV